MRNWTEDLKRLATPKWLALSFLVLFATCAIAQETTGGLQGTVKDPSGAVVAGATVTVTTPTLVGSKVLVTDASGYYHFSNLPPGSYVVEVKSPNFETYQRSGLIIEVGHLPTLEIKLKVGSNVTVVQVSADEAPQIDTTTVTTTTNVTSDVIDFVPHGLSFQSVIQFAPAASNEPLMGNTTTNGSGSVSPGNGSNGGAYGYSIAGGSDSENSYLVEGQETANLIGGYSHTNVPFDFIDQVEIKSSGVAAEYGGALGGVVNVIMKKGTNKWHGSAFSSFQSSALGRIAERLLALRPKLQRHAHFLGPDPTYLPKLSACSLPQQRLVSWLLPLAVLSWICFPDSGGSPTTCTKRFASASRYLRAITHNSIPENHLNYGTAAQGGGLGIVPFSQNFHTDYGDGRIDAEATQKIRVFGSWLVQGQKL